MVLESFMNHKCNICVSNEGICFYLWPKVVNPFVYQFVYIDTNSPRNSIPSLSLSSSGAQLLEGLYEDSRIFDKKNKDFVLNST